MRSVVENIEKALAEQIDEASPSDYKPDPNKDLISPRGGLGSHTPNSLKRNLKAKFEELADRLREAEELANAGDFERAREEIQFLKSNLYDKDVAHAYIDALLDYYDGTAKHYPGE